MRPYTPLLALLVATAAPAALAQVVSDDEAAEEGTVDSSVVGETPIAVDSLDQSDSDLAAENEIEQEQEVALEGPGLRASQLMDVDVYTLAETYNADFWNSGEPFGAIAADWTEVGEVEDVILDSQGEVAGVTIDVGGFLGIGQREVLLPFDDIRLVHLPQEEELFVVTRLDRDALESREEIETLWDE